MQDPTSHAANDHVVRVIVKACERKGITKPMFAEATGMKESYIRNTFNRSQAVSIAFLAQAAIVLDMPITSFFEGYTQAPAPRA